MLYFISLLATGVLPAGPDSDQDLLRDAASDREEVVVLNEKLDELSLQEIFLDEIPEDFFADLDEEE